MTENSAAVADKREAEVKTHNEEHHHEQHHLRHCDPHDLKRIRKATARTMMRTAIYAGLARIALGVIKSLLKGGLSKKLITHMQKELFNLNPVKWAVFVGGLSSFRLVQQVLLTKLGVPMRGASFAAGAISALSVFLFNAQTRLDLGLYLCMRALHGFSVVNIFPNLPGPLRSFNDYDTLAMVVAAMPLLYCCYFEPRCHDKGYQKFLVGQTMLDGREINGTAGMMRGHVVPDILELAQKRKMPIPTEPDMRQMCKINHPGISCNMQFLRFVARHFSKVSMPLYLPLKLISTVIFSSGKLKKQPVQTLTKIAKTSATSSLFLSLYVGNALRVMCAFQQNNIKSPLAIGLCCGVVAGIPTLLEPKGRRLDLALFCSMHAMRASVMLLARRGWIPAPTKKHVWIMYLASVAYMFHQYDMQPETLHPNIRSGLGWILAEKHHTPSHRLHGPRHHHHEEKHHEQKKLE